MLSLLWLPLVCNSQISFENPLVLNAANGLLEDYVTVVKEDAYGFAWIGTRKGLVLFDGITVKTFTHNDKDSTSLPNNNIYDIFPDEVSGRVWVTTGIGLSAYIPETKTFIHYKHDPNNPNSVPDHQCTRFFKDKTGQLWIGVRDGGALLYRPETDDFQRFIVQEEPMDNDLPAFWIKEFVEDVNNDSILWLGTHSGILKFNKHTGSFEQFYNDVKDERERSYSNSVRRMIMHESGKLFYGTWYVGIYIFDTNTLTYSRLDPCYQNGTSPFSKDVTLGFYKKSNDEFWINSNKGLQLYNARLNCITQSFENTKKEWYSIDHIDDEGRIWSASHIDGFRIFNPIMQQYQFVRYLQEDSYYASYSRKILEDTLRQKLYIASQMGPGLLIYDLKTGITDSIPPPVKYYDEDTRGMHAWDLALLDNGEVIIVEDRALLWYKQGEKRLSYYPAQPASTFPRLRNILKHSDGSFWVTGYRAGLMHLDVNRKIITPIDAEKYSEQWNRTIGGDALAEDIRGNIWIREHNGLLVYQRSNDSLHYIPYTSENTRALRGMGNINTDNAGGIWISTNREFLGFAHADSIEKGITKFYGKDHGMEGEKLYLALPYKDKLLTFTDRGMQVFNPVNERFEKYYDGDYGLGTVVTEAILLSDGRIAVCRPQAIAFFHPDSLVTNTEAPLPYVSNFKVFDSRWNLKSAPKVSDTVHLSYKQNFFSFEFSALGFNLPHETKFRYMLEGFDESWQDGTLRKFVGYTNVPGGDYRFIVEAINSEGQAFGERSVTYLHISTVWWKTVWFWGLITLFLLVVFWLISQYRIQQVRKEERLKSEYERKLADTEMSALRAQMNPHFIFNSLNSIEYYIINNEPEKASDYLNRFSRLIRLILQNSKNTIVPLKDDLEALKLYIEMESMRFDNLFDYEVKMEAGLDLEKITVPPMLMQPYVENAIWHGLMQNKNKKGKIDLVLRRSNGHLVCMIEDNGIGRQAAENLKSKTATKRKSYGMKITSDRLAILNKLVDAKASVQVYDLKDADGNAKGTRVELVIPL